MADPKDLDEYNKRIHLNQMIDGFGADTTMHMPCFFCGEPDFVSWKIMEMETTASIPNTCAGCGRSAKLIFNRDRDGIGFEVVQTGGPDQPEWLLPKMRRV